MDIDDSKWEKFGWLHYLNADDQYGIVVNAGKGVLTCHTIEGKFSWYPPADQLLLVWDEELKKWEIFIQAGEGHARLARMP